MPPSVIYVVLEKLEVVIAIHFMKYAGRGELCVRDF